MASAAAVPPHFDCVIVGAGPAGLTAATYLARYRRRVLVIDAGESRARWIPASHNCPGFPFGVAGNALLARFRAQAESYRVAFVHGRADTLECRGGRFHLRGDQGTWQSPCVLLATGIVDRLPPVANLDEAIATGRLRLCAVCDAYEARDEAIGVFAPMAQALDHAIFLRTFSSRVHVLAPEMTPPTAEQRRRAEDANVTLHTGVRDLRFAADGCTAVLQASASLRLDTVYPVLGCHPGTPLAVAMNALTDGDGKLIVDDTMQTTVPGLYAAGDVVSGLNQISVAVGQAAVAATAIHRRLPDNPWTQELSKADTQG